MKKFFLFILFNITGVITYKIINKTIFITHTKNKEKANTLNRKEGDTKMVSTSSQTDLTISDMLTLLEYKKALDNIYDDNVKYDWKFV